MKDILVRPESFGGVVYDPQTLGYFFINPSQLAELQTRLAIGKREAAVNEPDTDFSRGKYRDLLAAIEAGATVGWRVPPSPPPGTSLSAPIRVYLEITTLCNAACAYCLNNSGQPRPGSLSTKELETLIANMAKEGVFEVRITGGEPTKHPDFLRICKAVINAGLNLSLNSNLLVSKEMLAHLVELRPSLLITSLDSADGPQRRNRGRGYNTVVHNIDLLRRAGVPVRLNCTLTRDTLPHLDAFVERFAPLGCGFCFILVRPVGRAAAVFDPPGLDSLIRAVRLIAEREARYPHLYFSTSFHVVMDRELKLGNVNMTGCNACHRSFNVNSDGRVAPCAFLFELSPDDYCLGNVRNHRYSISALWQKSKTLRSLREKSTTCNVNCIKCRHFKRTCLGTCVFMNEYSRLSGKPDPYCRTSIEHHSGGVISHERGAA